MRWTSGGRSDNLEDRRGASGGGFRSGGGGMKLGLGGTVVLIVLSLIFKRDLLTEFSGGVPGGQTAPSTQSAPVVDASEEKMVQFVSFVLDDAQGFWKKSLPQMGTEYRDATLVVFRDATDTACGFGESATGPFYCPGDEKVYIDLAFFDELRQKFKAPGDFAQAYVLSHEIGHHVQKLLGTSEQVQRARQGNRGSANELSVRLELQADCYAGVWAASAAQRDKLDPGDTEEGLAAAAAVGDDRLQKVATGRVSPESWTHGSSAQRIEWFNRGFKAGDPRSCDTFGR